MDREKVKEQFAQFSTGASYGSIGAEYAKAYAMMDLADAIRNSNIAEAIKGLGSLNNINGYIAG